MLCPFLMHRADIIKDIYSVLTLQESYNGLFNNPIIVNGQNILNVTECENGIGVIDCFGNTVMENKYDSVHVELKLTATNKTETATKIISFSKNIFQKGIVYDFDEWI